MQFQRPPVNWYHSLPGCSARKLNTVYWQRDAEHLFYLAVGHVPFGHCSIRREPSGYMAVGIYFFLLQSGLCTLWWAWGTCVWLQTFGPVCSYGSGSCMGDLLEHSWCDGTPGGTHETQRGRTLVMTGGSGRQKAQVDSIVRQMPGVGGFPGFPPINKRTNQTVV